MSRNVRIVHISDLHMRSPSGPQGQRAAYEMAARYRLIDTTWPDNVRALLGDGKPVDIIAFTGDVGDWGHATDYPGAITFLRELCELTELDPRRVYVVPGNHDIARTTHEETWRALREAIATAAPRAVSEWMAGGAAPPGFDDAWRELVLERERPFWDAMTGTLVRPDMAPWSSPHRRLGYRATIEPSPRGLIDLGRPTFPIHIIGLDSAWLAGDDHDAGKLRLTEHQVELLTTHEGASLPGLRIALMHHRFADLADGVAMRRLLAGRVDVLLHGHQHEAVTDPLADPDRNLLVFAAGCLYDGGESHRHTNAFQVIDLEVDEAGRPQHIAIRFRGWSHSALCWGDGALLYRHAPGGRLRLRRTRHGWAPGDPPPEPHRPRPTHAIFVGRTDELAQLDAAFTADPSSRIAIVALQGMGGVGKTHLAQAFLRDRTAPVERLVLDPAAPGTAAAWLQHLAARRHLPAGPDAPPPAHADLRATEARVRDDLRATGTVVCIDNVDSEAAASTVVELAAALAGVPMIVVGRVVALGTDPGWTRIEVAPLTLDESIALVRAEIGASTFSDGVLRDLAKMLGRLPLALHLAGGYLRAGHAPDHFLHELDKNVRRLSPRDPPDHFRRERAGQVVGATLDVSRELFLKHARTDRDRWAAGYAALAFAPLAGFNRSLAAAICDFDEDDFSIDDFLTVAVDHALLRRDTPARWSIHPMLASLAQHDQRDRFGSTADARAAVDERISIWISMLAHPAAGHDRAARWAMLAEAHAEIAEWLRSGWRPQVAAATARAWRFATAVGPVAPWLDAARAHDPQTASLDLLWAHAQLSWRAGLRDECERIARTLAGRAWTAGDEDLELRALALVAALLDDRGAGEEALAVRRSLRARLDALPLAAQIYYGSLDGAPALRDHDATAETLAQLASLHADHDQLDDAARLLARALPIHQRRGDPLGLARCRLQIASVLQRQGRVDEALRLLEEDLVPALRAVGDGRACAGALRTIAELVAGRGEHERALAILRDEVTPLDARTGDARARAATLTQIGDVLAASGRHAEALRAWRDEVLPAYDVLADPRAQANVLARMAAVYLDGNLADTAIGLLRSALDKVTSPPELSLVFHRLADALARRGRPADITESRTCFRRARDLARTHDLDGLTALESRCLALGID